jgi:hypothetical protein
MDRKIFLKSACGLGLCSCLGTGLLSNSNLFASQNQLTNQKENFIKYRFAKLIGILDSTLDENTKNQIIENLGKECANNSFSKNYINNIDGFFKEIHSSS